MIILPFFIYCKSVFIEPMIYKVKKRRPYNIVRPSSFIPY